MEEMSAGDIAAILRAQRPQEPVGAQATEPNRVEAESFNSLSDGVPEEQASDRSSFHFKRLSLELFKEMPEVAAAERNAVIFMGYIADDQTLFVATRMVPAQVTFRLLHRELPKLQSSTQKLMLNLLYAKLAGEPLTLKNPSVSLYERGFDHVMINGRVITSAWRETFKSNLKDFLLFLIPLGLFIPTLYALIALPPSVDQTGRLWHGTLERFNTALLTTAVVSALGLFHTWLQIRRGRLIDWSVVLPQNSRSSE